MGASPDSQVLHSTINNIQVATKGQLWPDTPVHILGKLSFLKRCPLYSLQEWTEETQRLYDGFANFTWETETVLRLEAAYLILDVISDTSSEHSTNS